jgi:hypothetical protein
LAVEGEVHRREKGLSFTDNSNGIHSWRVVR